MSHDTRHEVFRERVNIWAALAWTVEDNLAWALTDHCEAAALAAGAITTDTECHVERSIDGDDFVQTVVIP